MPRPGSATVSSDRRHIDLPHSKDLMYHNSKIQGISICRIPKTSCTTIPRYKAYLKQYVAVTRSEPVRLAAAKPRPDLSQRRIGGCSRSVHESCGLERPRTGHKSSSFLHRRCWEIPISLAASLSEINSLMPPFHPIERSKWTRHSRTHTSRLSSPRA